MIQACTENRQPFPDGIQPVAGLNESNYEEKWRKNNNYLTLFFPISPQLSRVYFINVPSSGTIIASLLGRGGQPGFRIGDLTRLGT